MNSESTTVNQPAKRFGTFLGVYTPSVLTILGVMMYLRFGWVLGNLGLPLTLLTVLMASSITFITGLSASAISTNMKVGVGGEYYMVSRSIGLEFGGAIGIPLFLCRTLSLTLYAFGLAESLAPFWPQAWGPAPVQLIAAAIILLTTAVAGKSADLSLKLQLPIMFAVGASLLALLIGVLSGGVGSPEMVPHYTRSAPQGFWFVFAVFFPAVTGFTAGIGLSGDLQNPQKSIPRGTILAVATGSLVYVGVMLMLAFTAKVDGPTLATIDPTAPPIWTRIALFGMVLIYPGMWGAILSSAFGSILGGPRVLQALALDNLAPSALGRTSKTGQPTVATWVTGGIALAAVALGDLNAVGRWVTIFFLTLYVVINMSAVLEKLAGDVSYRPTIRVPWIISLLGSFGAGAVMFLISPLAGLFALVLEISIYLLLRRRSLHSSWGDVRAGMWTSIARFALLRLKNKTTHARNWRPNILLFSEYPSKRITLTRMATWFNQNRGIVTVCKTIEGDWREKNEDVKAEREQMDKELAERGMVIFPEVHVVPNFESGIIDIVQANGFAGLHSNTVMFGWAKDTDRIQRLLRLVGTLTRMKRNSILACLPESHHYSNYRRIDVWWRGMQNNGELMLLLAHLVQLNPEWRSAKLRVRSIVESIDQQQPMTDKINQMMVETRIPAESDVLVKEKNESYIDIMHEASKDADLVFMGLALPNAGDEKDFAERLEHVVSKLKATILVKCAESFAGQLIE